MTKQVFNPAHYKILFGPPPILTTEDGECFEDTFNFVINALKPEDMVALITVRRYVEANWIVNRLTRHGTVAIERLFRQSAEYRAERLRLQKERKEAQTRKHAEQAGQAPADIAHLVALEDNIVNSASDVDEILEREATEIEHNRALEASIFLQEHIERWINSATKRANKSLRQLELYRAGLGQTVQRAARQVLDAKPKKDPPDDVDFQEFQ